MTLVADWLFSDIQLVEKIVQNLDVFAVFRLNRKLAIICQIIVSRVDLAHVIRKLPESPSMIFDSVFHLIHFDLHVIRGGPADPPHSPFQKWFGPVALLFTEDTYFPISLLSRSSIGR
jgi:hypothetical protein